ncbi:hypothetical protein [Roseibium sp.]|uniref:hypothetical protein n=1 Tax=Roseibium sp. TaxID=1936156 RepID=UPI003A97ADD4
MMVEPKSSATILALADLADLSAKQLEDGRSIEEVIETLRAAALAVRNVIDPNDRFPQDDAADEETQDAAMETADEEASADEEPDEISA